MKTKSAIFITLICVLLVSTSSANAAPTTAAVSQPWSVQLFKGGEDNVQNLSTAFVGGLQIPMLSYSKTGSQLIYLAHAVSSAGAGNCGPEDTWFCYTWDVGVVPGSLSEIAKIQLIDTHLVGWAYSTGSMIRGGTVEFANDMSYVDVSSQDLIQLSKFGGILVGAPSLQIVGGRYRLAATIRSGGDFPTYKLVYMYYIGEISNSSCIDGGVAYQCDVIDESTALYSMGTPSLQVAPDANVGIAYYKYGGGTQNGVMYAYPHVHSSFFPSNCGPGDPQTWRCISIYKGTETGTLGMVVKFAFGQASSDRGIVFTYDDGMIEDTLYNAKYVDSGGNCGLDGGAVVTYKWQCTEVTILGDLAADYTPSYSIAVDPEGYSVIAYNRSLNDSSPIHLYLVYPKERIGIPDPGWTEQKIDGAPSTTIATGAQADLSFSRAGLGFISYLQEEEYELPDLKTAWQQVRIALPIIMK